MDDDQQFWQARNNAIQFLETEGRREASSMRLLFDLMDACILRFEHHSTERNSEIYGLTLLKARNLALGTLSLVLDGLGQEAGALTRPLIEYIELLQYLRENPGEIDALYAGKVLPSAGVRAKKINGIYKDFREHLNQHASHSAYSYYSLSHLREPRTGKWRLFQKHSPSVLHRNLGDLAVQIYVLLRHALLCLKDVDSSAFIQLGSRYDSTKPILFDVFKLDERLGETNHGIK